MALASFECTTKGISAGVTHCKGHFGDAISRITEQLLGLRQPNFLQEVVEGHPCRSSEQGGEIGGDLAAVLPC
jgi:hypothetical protein